MAPEKEESAQVREIMTKGVVYLDASKTVEDASKLMNEKNVGSYTDDSDIWHKKFEREKITVLLHPKMPETRRQDLPKALEAMMFGLYGQKEELIFCKRRLPNTTGILFLTETLSNLEILSRLATLLLSRQ